MKILPLPLPFLIERGSVRPPSSPPRSAMLFEALSGRQRGGYEALPRWDGGVVNSIGGIVLLSRSRGSRRGDSPLRSCLASLPRVLVRDPPYPEVHNARHCLTCVVWAAAAARLAALFSSPPRYFVPWRSLPAIAFWQTGFHQCSLQQRRSGSPRSCCSYFSVRGRARSSARSTWSRWLCRACCWARPSSCGPGACFCAAQRLQ